MHLNVDQSTVYRTIALFDATGDVKKAEYSRKGQSHHLQKLTDIDHQLIMEAVLDRPGIYLHEIQEYLRQQTWMEIFAVFHIQLPTWTKVHSPENDASCHSEK